MVSQGIPTTTRKRGLLARLGAGTDRAPGARQRTLFVGASLTPVMAIFIAFSILPIIAVIVFSFFRYSFSYPDHTFRGLSYYQQLTADPLFWNGLKRTAEFVVLAVPLNILLSLPAALGLQRVTRLKGTLRAFFFLPTIISGVALISDTGASSVNASCAAGYMAPAPTWLVQLPRISV